MEEGDTDPQGADGHDTLQVTAEPLEVLAVNGCVELADTVAESGETLTMTGGDDPPQLMFAIASTTRNSTCRTGIWICDFINHPFPHKR